MSGGHWNYGERQLRQTLEDVSYDIKKDVPNLSVVLEKLSGELYHIIKDLDYHYCGDSIIHSFVDFEKESLQRLTKVLE